MKKNILIVEDNYSKQEEIIRVLPPTYKYETYATASIATAYKIVELAKWDLVILDMTFQISNDSGNQIAKEALAGIEVLQYLSRKKILAPVIVATQHTTFHTPELPGIDSIQKLHDLLSELFPRNYFATVHVDLSGESWKAQLAETVIRALEQ